MPDPTTSPAPDTWKGRLRAPSVSGGQIAALAPERGIAVKAHNGLPQLHAWDIATGEFRPLTDKPGGAGFGLLSPDGTYVYYMDDTKGSEIGSYVRVPYSGGAPEPVTPNLPPYSASTIAFPQPSLAFSASGNAFLFRFNDVNGYNLCRLDIAPDGALGEPKLLYTSKSLFRAPLLSAEGQISVIASSERTGKQQYHLFAFDADGKRLDALEDGPGNSLEPVVFSRWLGTRALRQAPTKPGSGGLSCGML